MKIERKESAIEATFTRLCKAEGWLVRKLAYPGRRGAPDRIVYGPYPIVELVEVKVPGKDPDPLQVVEHEALQRLGHRVWVIRDEADALGFKYHLWQRIRAGGLK